MNARIERAMNCENFGARIMENRALDQKIWALEAYRGNTVFSRCSRTILEFLECLEGLGPKDRAPVKFGDFQRFLWNFGGFRVVYDLFIIIF
jgi:hypothetical protein